VIRRLHSLTGLVPIGAFLILHFITNAAILTAETIQLRVDQIHPRPDHARAGGWDSSSPILSTG
jgi:succinate dehydrogenase / fumarate reductase cytochrome b subunit